MVEKETEKEEMLKKVDRYHQIEDQKRNLEGNLRQHRKTELEYQMEENQRVKNAKKEDEKRRDAAIMREYDRIQEEREHERNTVR